MSVVTSFGGVVAGFSAAQRLDNVIMLPAHVRNGGDKHGRAEYWNQNWDRVHTIAKYGCYLIS